MIDRKTLQRATLIAAAAILVGGTHLHAAMSDCFYLGHGDFFRFRGWWDFGGLVGLFWIAIRILFALAVLRDARDLEASGQGTTLVGVWVWTAATLLGGAIAAGIYWVMNRSTLRPAARANASAG